MKTETIEEKLKRKGVDVETLKQRISKSFKEVAEITFKRHKKSFKKLSE